MGIDVKVVTNQQTCEDMQRIKELTGELICPHTAVGTYAAQCLPGDDRVNIVLSTAHAAKFPETVKEVTGIWPDLPQRCTDLHNRPERFDIVPSDLAQIKNRLLA